MLLLNSITWPLKKFGVMALLRLERLIFRSNLSRANRVYAVELKKAAGK